MPQRVESRRSGLDGLPPPEGSGRWRSALPRRGVHQGGKPANEATVRYILSLLTPEPERRGDIQWIRAERLLAIHRLGPLAFASDRALGGGLLPRSMAGRLEAGYLAAREATLRYLAVEEAIGVAFRSDGIPFLRFGGIALVRDGTYAEPGARPVDGLELLVPARAAIRAARRLRALGLEPAGGLDSQSFAAASSFVFHSHLRPEDGGVRVELTLAGDPADSEHPAGADDTLFWAGANIEDGSPAPCPHLALMAERLVAGIGDRSYLRRLADIGRLIPRVESWERFVRIAGPRPYAAGVGLLLKILEEETGSPVPRGVIRSLGGSKIGLRPIASRIRPSNLLRRGVPGPGLSADLLRRGALLATPAQALRAAVAAIWPGEGWLRARFSEPSSPLGRLRARHLIELLDGSIRPLQRRRGAG